MMTTVVSAATTASFHLLSGVKSDFGGYWEAVLFTVLHIAPPGLVFFNSPIFTDFFFFLQTSKWQRWLVIFFYSFFLSSLIHKNNWCFVWMADSFSLVWLLIFSSFFSPNDLSLWVLYFLRVNLNQKLLIKKKKKWGIKP